MNLRRKSTVFKKCANKGFVFENDRSGRTLSVALECPRTEESSMPVSVRASDGYSKENVEVSHYWLPIKGGYNQVIHYDGIDDAIEHLAQSATRAVCGDCPFARMTPLEASEELADIVESKALVAQNDLRRLTAQAALQSALGEIQAIEVGVGLRPQPQLEQ